MGFDRTESVASQTDAPWTPAMHLGGTDCVQVQLWNERARLAPATTIKADHRMLS